jgi:uncharacterized DUF497 family protein
VHYNFEWYPGKAKQNLEKHIFLDPFAVSIYDEDHSTDEDRWVTMGKDRAGKLLVAIHTFSSKSKDLCHIRMISAWIATKNEVKQYEGDMP